MPSEIPEGYQIGPAERHYLEQFEKLRREGIPMTPLDFAKRMKLADTSAFRRYAVLKAVLNEYGWKTRPDRMRGEPPALLQKVDLGPDPEIERLQRRMARLEAAAVQIQEKADTLSATIEARDAEIVMLRGGLMATITHFSSASMSRALGVESDLARIYESLNLRPCQCGALRPRVMDGGAR